MSYLLAARYVMERAEASETQNEVGLPTAYLQRHAFELALKHVLGMAVEIAADESWLAALRLNAHADRPTRRDVPFVHQLGSLVRQVDVALAAIQYDPMPNAFTLMAERLVEAEQHEPTRLRYPEIRPKGGQVVVGFPHSVMLAVGETQQQLELLFEEHLTYQGHEVDDVNVNLMTDLCYHCMSLDQSILASCHWNDSSGKRRPEAPCRRLADRDTSALTRRRMV
jgi:hypothetical protein